MSSVFPPQLCSRLAQLETTPIPLALFSESLSLRLYSFVGAIAPSSLALQHHHRHLRFFTTALHHELLAPQRASLRHTSPPAAAQPAMPRSEVMATVARSRARRSHAARVSYTESDGHDSDDGSPPEKRVRTSYTQARVREFANAMPRPDLESLICSMFKSSAEFRARFKAEMDKKNLDTRELQPLPRSHSSRLGSLGRFPAEGMPPSPPPSSVCASG